MPKVHLFTLQNELYDDTRIPFQYRGNGQAAEARAFELSYLLSWIEANISLASNAFSVQTETVSNNGTVAVAAGRLVAKVVVIGGSSGTFNLGTTASGTELIDTGSFDTDGAVYALDNYFHSGGTLHFSGGFAGSLTVKLILINLT